MAARNYSSVARATTLTSSVSGATTLWPVTETTGFPTAPFTLVADPGRPGEEAVTVTNVVGLNLTVSRGQDGTAAQPHDAGASLRHMATARDFREPADHIAATTGVHGLVGGLVGLTDNQDLDNKTFTPAVGDHTPVTFKQAPGQTTPLLVFKSSADTILGSVTVAGRPSVPGIASTVNSTFTGAATDIPVTIQGAVAHSAHLVSIKNSGATELAFIDALGNVNTPNVTSVTSTVSGTATSGSVATGNITSTGRVATVGVDGTGTSVFTPAGTANTPLVAVSPTGSTVSAFAVRDAATNTSQAGIGGENAGFRLYHGGDNTNYLPWRQHSGSVVVNIVAGNSATNDTISLTGMGFTVAPIVQLTVAGPSSGNEARVISTISARSTTSISIRTMQSAATALAADQNYTVYWTATQMTSSSAGG